jgi:hypothetical protein
MEETELYYESNWNISRSRAGQTQRGDNQVSLEAGVLLAVQFNEFLVVAFIGEPGQVHAFNVILKLVLFHAHQSGSKTVVETDETGTVTLIWKED